MTADLVDRVVVVTGGTLGLGEATARLASSRGACVAVVGRDAERGERIAGELPDATFVRVDLGDPDAASTVMDAVDARYGVVHGLANVAALTERGGIWDTTAELVDRMMAVNVRAPLLMTQAAARIMKREGVAGSVVNVGSISGYGGDAYLLPYAVSKGALHTLTRNAAFSLMRDRIRVNLVNPGWMITEGEDAIQRRYHGAQDGWLERAAAQQPFGRLIDPDEVARTICFLLSDESGLMTGASIDFDQSVTGAGNPPKPTPSDTWP